MSDYPKWVYNAEKGGVMVETPEQEAALPGRWHDSPAAFGVETHPEAPLQTSAVMGMPLTLPSALTPSMVMLDDQAARLAMLEGRVAALETASADMQRWRLAMSSPADSPPAKPADSPPAKPAAPPETKK